MSISYLSECLLLVLTPMAYTLILPLYVFVQFQLVKSSKQHHTYTIFYKGNGNYKFATVFFFPEFILESIFESHLSPLFFACLKWCSFPGKKPSHSSFLPLPKGFFQYIVLWCQPIKLIQVVSTSEFHEYCGKTLILFFCPLHLVQGLRSNNINRS